MTIGMRRRHHEDPAVRLRAARNMLTVGLRLHQAADVADRSRDLEPEPARKQGPAP
jgi:hypothetical protein